MPGTNMSITPRGRGDNIRNVISNVTEDNSLNASGIGNTFNITYNMHRPE